MIVEEIMNTELSTLSKDDKIKDAMELMREKRIRHIPIIDKENHLEGIVTDRDIKEAGPSIFHSDDCNDILEQPLSSIMSTNIITGHPLDFVEDVAAIFYEQKISCMPIVVKNNQLVGIVTQTDLLHTFVELTGVHQPGSLVEVKVRNKRGMIYRVVSCAHKCKANILSVLVYPDKKDEDFKIIVLRVQTMNPLRLIDELEKEGTEVLWPNLPGMDA